MVDRIAVKENLDSWLENPGWAEFWHQAPSPSCREYIAMQFYASETEEEEAFSEMDRLEEQLGVEDLLYLYRRISGPEKGRLAGLIAQRSGNV